MSRIDDDLIEAVKQATDLVDLVGQSATLKKSGNTFKCCCPFHREKTPSFHVYPASQYWKCYGACGEGGNCFKYVMKRDGLTFPEAVRQLAADAGIAIDAPSPGDARRAERTRRLREITEWACKQFEAGLRAPGGEAAREYFRGRGITGETARRFRLGFALPGWENLLRAGARDGISPAELEEAGLAIARDPEHGRGPGHYDRFRDRVVFPICDARGRPIAFGARTLGDDEPKYLNSPETPLFTKGRHLYALHLAKDEMLRNGTGAVMEGYTDVVMAHQQGWPVAVAGLGTALTPDQAKLAARYVKRLYLVYDGDQAGRRAAERATQVFLPQTIDARVAILPEGSDPFDLFRNGGLPAFQPVLDSARGAFDHLLDARKAAHDARTPAGRQRVVDEMIEFLGGVTDFAVRQAYVRRIVEELQLAQHDEQRILDSIRRQAQARQTQARQAQVRQTQAPRTARSEPSDPPWDGYGAVSEDLEADPVHEPVPRTPPPPEESQLVQALLLEPTLLDAFRDELGPDDLGDVRCRRLLDRMLDVAESGPFELDALLESLADPVLVDFAAGLHARGREFAVDSLRQQAEDCLSRIRARREQVALHEEFSAAEDADSEAEALRRLQELHRRRASDGDAPTFRRGA